MNNSLAQDGLPELSLSGVATTEVVGGTKDVVAKAVDDLEKEAESLYALADELASVQQELTAQWDSTAAGQLDNLFPPVIEAFQLIKPSLISLAQWADDTCKRYVAADESSAEDFTRILGGL